MDRTPLLKKVFSALDVDGDGTVSLKEFLATAKNLQEEEMELPMLMTFMDDNGDGVLSFEEWEKGITMLGGTDESFEKEMKDVLQVLWGAKMAAALDDNDVGGTETVAAEQSATADWRTALEPVLTQAVRTSLQLPAAERLAFVGRSLQALAEGQPAPAIEHKRARTAGDLPAEMAALAEALTVALNQAARGQFGESPDEDRVDPLRAVGEQIMKGVRATERITGAAPLDNSRESVTFSSEAVSTQSSTGLSGKWTLDADGFVRTSNKVRREREKRLKKPVNLAKGASFHDLLPPEVQAMRLAEDTRQEYVREVAAQAFALYAERRLNLLREAPHLTHSPSLCSPSQVRQGRLRLHRQGGAL
jgi:hypothetical protein